MNVDQLIERLRSAKEWGNPLRDKEIDAIQDKLYIAKELVKEVLRFIPQRAEPHDIYELAKAFDRAGTEEAKG